MEVLLTPKPQYKFDLYKKRFEEFIASERFLPIFGVLVLFFHLLGRDMLGVTFIFAYLTVVFLSDADIRATLPVFAMLIFTASLEQGFYRVGSSNPIVYIENIPFLIILLSLSAVGITVGLIRRYKYRISSFSWMSNAHFPQQENYTGDTLPPVSSDSKIKKETLSAQKNLRTLKTSWGLIGVIAMGLSFILGGLFSGGYNIMAFVMGLVFAVMFIGFFLVGKLTTKKIDFDYLAKVLILMSLVAVIQLLIVYIYRDIFSTSANDGGNYAKYEIAVGWGHSNSIAVIIALGLPFSLYFMATHEKPYWAFGVFAVQVLAVILCLSRAMTFLIIPVAILGLAYSIYRQRKKTRLFLIIATGATVVIALVVFLVQMENILSALAFYIEAGLDDNDRFAIYRQAWQAFIRNPIFGAGLVYDTPYLNFSDFLFMAHNSFLQFLAWGGIIGFSAFIFHLVVTTIALFKKPNEKRMILFVVALLVIGNSMLEVFLFMPPTLIIYMLVIGAIDNDAIEQDGFGRIEIKKQKEMVVN
ncbi:MAG: O-antigen ligase family protein [Firmicutes bacterium]|nr:O-antigen ligase family protein [Bacillota bacterium]